jgi:peptidoglycan/LPS O-acetylase OafA/YrhL
VSELTASTPATARQTHYLPTLDGWRACAILMVILHHGSYSISDGVGPWIRPFTRFFYYYGELGVQVFFAISGLLICSRLIQEHADRSRVSLRDFYVRRAYRILPPMMGFLGIVGALGAVGIVTIKLGQWLSCVFLYANYRPGGTWTLGHFWTLSLEEHFYLTWPFLFAFLGPRKTLPVTILLALGVGVWRGVNIAYSLHPFDLTHATVRTDTMCDGLLYGAVMALLLARPGIRERLMRVMRPVMFYVLLGVYIGTFLPMPPVPFLGPGLSILRAMVLPMLLATTLLNPRSLVSRVLELGVLRYVGRLSYSLYLYQQLFFVWHGLGSPFLTPIQSFPLNFVCAFACAAGSYYLIEKPAIRAGYRRVEVLRGS